MSYGIKNTKTAFDGGSCEWTEGESNPKSELARTLPDHSGLGPRVHVRIIYLFVEKTKELTMK